MNLSGHVADLPPVYSQNPWDLVARLNSIGIALTSETNLGCLLELIVTEARALTHCDGGSLYTVEDGMLHFQVAQNETLSKRPPDDQPQFKKMTLSMSPESIAGYVAISGDVVNIPDVYRLPPDLPYSFNKAFTDERYGYRTTSMLAVPLRTRQRDVVGVLQLINALDDSGNVVPFGPFNEMLCRSMASHAAVALNNARHLEYIKKAQERIIRAEKLAALGQLTAGVAHEVLNPLSVITMRLEMLIENTEMRSDIDRHLKTMLEQAERIGKITQDLLYFGRQREPERRRLDFNQTVGRTLDLLAHDLKGNTVDVVLELAEELPPVTCDHDQMQQVILNLLTNAHDAMPKGGRLIVRTSPVHLNGESFVELRVKDTGRGIPAENLEKLFDPFFSTKPEGQGTGLGLSICQGIIEAHGGSIWAESEVGSGSTFVVRLPLTPAEGVKVS